MDKNLRQQIVDDIKRVAQMIGKTNIGRSEYLQYGKFSQYQIYDGGCTWGELCRLSGISSKEKDPVADEIYFQKLASAIKILGRYPKSSERKKFGLNMSKRRYPTLKDFIKKAVELGMVEDLFKNDKGRERPSLIENEEKAFYCELLTRAKATRSTPAIPKGTKRLKWERIDIEGFPYAPQEEQGVLALFAILCAQGILPWQILDLSAGKGIDATCYDEKNNREINVELKYLLSKSSWNHSVDELDYVVCWENRWKDFLKPVIELSKLLKKAK